MLGRTAFFRDRSSSSSSPSTIFKSRMLSEEVEVRQSATTMTLAEATLTTTTSFLYDLDSDDHDDETEEWVAEPHETPSACSSISNVSRKFYSECNSSGLVNTTATLDDATKQQEHDDFVIPLVIRVPNKPSRGDKAASTLQPPAPLWSAWPSPLPEQSLPPKRESSRDLLSRLFPLTAPSSLESSFSILLVQDTTQLAPPTAEPKSSFSREEDEPLALLGNRPMRYRKRAVSTAATYSVGSIVGQSSLITTPLSSSSSSWSAATSESTRNHATLLATMQRLNHHHRLLGTKVKKRATDVIKEELKYMLGRVATPIRRLAQAETEKALLKRADGCLT
jgi:hypothetical protein